MSFLKEIFKRKEEKKQPEYDRELRELLRENLKTISVDMFYLEDPIMQLNPQERREYLLYFNKLWKDRKLIKRWEFLMNKQAQTMLLDSKDKTLDSITIMKLDGMGTLKDDVERLSKMFLTEEAMLNPPKPSAQDLLRI